MTSFQTYVGNAQDLDLSDVDYYAAILGEKPSQGAKSPSLWNAAFRAHGISAKMVPMDVSVDNLGKLIEVLRDDARFIGGAVTMPYKEVVGQYLDELEDTAQVIGAVNVLYRQGTKLVGANTDGAGALASLEAQIDGSLSGMTILILGLGGAGKAVAAFLAQAVGKDGTMLLANRTQASSDEYAGRLRDWCNVEVVQWPVGAASIAKVDTIVNCTSVGFEGERSGAQGVYSLEGFSPLGELESVPHLVGDFHKQSFLKKAAPAIGKNVSQSLALLAEAKVSTSVFDIVYQPVVTTLLSHAKLAGLRTVSGTGMNLEQAVIACHKAIIHNELSQLTPSQVREAMKPLW
ncbi:MAG: hypothetical protein HQ488_00085 [Parcubacteria group bacterium]|nr:hypothetical protein [Parcubacteria group bacterium]